MPQGRRRKKANRPRLGRHALRSKNPERQKRLLRYYGWQEKPDAQD